jgi:hypothetical protein
MLPAVSVSLSVSHSSSRLAIHCVLMFMYQFYQHTSARYFNTMSMTQALCRWSVTAEAWIRSQASSHWIYGVQSGTWTDFFSPSTSNSLLPVRIIQPALHIHLPPRLYSIWNWIASKIIRLKHITVNCCTFKHLKFALFFYYFLLHWF